MFFIESALFLISSALTLGLTFYQVPNRTLQQIVVMLLVVLLVFLSRIPSQRLKPSRMNGFRLLLLFLSSFFVQLLVISSGGFYSPFLIVIHLYALGTSFLLNMEASLSFLILSLITLAANIYLNTNMRTQFYDDPWSVALFMISFIVIIPLSQILTRSYHLKDALSKMLSEYIKIEEMRQESILLGLTELIVVTDSNLKILSINNAVERALKIAAPQVVRKDLLDVLPLKDSEDKPATAKMLSIDQIMRDKAARIVGGLWLQPQASKTALQVDIQIRPVINTQGQITQIAFVIKEATRTHFSHSKHGSTEQASAKRKAILNHLHQAISSGHQKEATALLELVAHIDDDILLYTELMDYPVKNQVIYQDITQLLKKVVEEKQLFAQSLGTKLEFVLPSEEVSEQALMGLQGTSLPSEVLPISFFSAPVSQKWFELMIEKIVELSVLLTASTVQKQVTVTMRRNSDNTFDIYIGATIQPYPLDLNKELFLEDYGGLGTTSGLRLGSGFEGVIIATISKQIGVQVGTIRRQHPPAIYFTVHMEKGARK